MSSEVEPRREASVAPAPPRAIQPAQQQPPAEVVQPGPPPWVEQMLQNQARDIELRGAQLELSREQEQHAYDYSRESLNAQAIDRREERTTRSGTIKHLCWIVVLIIFLILGFFGTLILTGHETVALELAKVLIYGGLGAAGGYGVAKSRSARADAGE